MGFVRVLSVPDWRAGNSYQQLLADALKSQGIETIFSPGYRRGLPLFRMCRDLQPDLIHLHWPEAFLGSSTSDAYRTWRFPIDLALCCRRIPLVYTSHNLRPHNSKSSWHISRVYQSIVRSAVVVIAHSLGAGEAVVAEFPDAAAKMHVIPHGDLSSTLPAAMSRQASRHALQLSETPVCLMFGAVEPYKGVEDVLTFWNQYKPGIRLVVAGRVSDESYETSLRSLAAGNSAIDLRFGWLSDAELRQWLSAADVVLFNYRTILTSGAACLARSLGIPIVLPSRLTTVDLGEPHSHVIRFQGLDEQLTAALEAALKVGVNWDSAALWREQTSWSSVAQLTAQAYHVARASFRNV
jgi:beta-1,4-mannosyltransferase